MNDDFEKLWLDDQSWKLGSIYYCKDDPRIVVRKRRRWAGWTFNFAHRAAYILLILVLIIAGAPANYVIYQNQMQYLPHAIALSAVVAIFVTYLFSKIGRGQ